VKRYFKSKRSTRTTEQKSRFQGSETGRARELFNVVHSSSKAGRVVGVNRMNANTFKKINSPIKTKFIKAKEAFLVKRTKSGCLEIDTITISSDTHDDFFRTYFGLYKNDFQNILQETKALAEEKAELAKKGIKYTDVN
jgi:hypothetical protein